MEDKLIRQLQEEDLFPNATSEEIADREKNRPPRVADVEVLKQTLCFVTMDLGKSELIELLLTGESSINIPIEGMSTSELITELGAWIPAYQRSSRNLMLTPERKERLILVMIKDYMDEEYDKIEGL